MYSKEVLDTLDKVHGEIQQENKNMDLNLKKEYMIIGVVKKKLTGCYYWDINSLNFLDNYNLKYHKIASAMIVDKNFLIEVSKRKNIHLYLQGCHL